MKTVHPELHSINGWDAVRCSDKGGIIFLAYIAQHSIGVARVNPCTRCNFCDENASFWRSRINVVDFFYEVTFDGRQVPVDTNVISSCLDDDV